MEDDVNISDLSLDEQMAVLMTELPEPIQRFLQSPERDAVSLRLTQKHGLHADVAATFERAYLYMLLGVYTPDEFVHELRKGGVDDTTIRGLATDVNEQVFKRLREQEKQSSDRAERVPTYRTQPRVAQVPPMRVGEDEPAAMQATEPEQKPLTESVPAEPSVPTPPQVEITPPSNLPGQNERPQWAPPPTAPVHQTPVTSPRHEKTPLTKQYGNDPYREAIG